MQYLGAVSYFLFGTEKISYAIDTLFSYLSLGKGAGRVASARVCFCSEPRGGVKGNNNGELLKKKKWLGAIVQHVCSEPRGGIIKVKTVEDRLGSVFALSHEVA